MSGAERRTAVVTNPRGLHLRPATALAQLARTFEARVRVTHGDKSGDARSPFDWMLLMAFEGATLELAAEGADAAAALDALCRLVQAPEAAEHPLEPGDPD